MVVPVKSWTVSHHLSPQPVLDHIREGHQLWDKLVQLSFVFQPDPTLDVHGNAAEVCLVREVHRFLSQRAVADLSIPIFEPFLTGIYSPVWSFKQISAEALPMAAHTAVRASEMHSKDSKDSRLMRT